jgi:hypothetical protein
MIFVGVILLIIVFFGILLLINYRKMNARSLPGYIIKKLNDKAKEPPTWLKKWVSFEEMAPVEKYFRSIMNTSKKMGIQIAASRTPKENINAIIDAIPESESTARIFLKEYERALFSRRHPNIKKTKISARKIKNLILTKAISNYFNDAQHKAK